MPTIKRLSKNNKTESKKEAQSIYNTPEWKKLRRAKYSKNPLCEKCLLNNIIKPTEEIHHIIPISRGNNQLEKKELAFNMNNLISLCKECHKGEHKLNK